MRGAGLPPRLMLRNSIRLRIANAYAEGLFLGFLSCLILVGAVAFLNL